MSLAAGHVARRGLDRAFGGQFRLYYPAGIACITYTLHVTRCVLYNGSAPPSCRHRTHYVYAYITYVTVTTILQGGIHTPSCAIYVTSVTYAACATYVTSQVLVSIQSIIMVPKPYFNEPGYAEEAGTPAGEERSREYNENVRHHTMHLAICRLLATFTTCRSLYARPRPEKNT